MTTKKQRTELEEAVSKWVFEGLADTWSTPEILVQVAKDWRGVVGIPSTPKAFAELAEWQGIVLGLVGLRTSWEAMEQQRVRSAGIVLSAFSGAGEENILALMGVQIAQDILDDSFTGRPELLESGRNLVRAIS